MTRIRRMAVTMCAAAAGVFVMALATTAEPVAASPCYEFCEARYATGMNGCDSEYLPGTDENADCHMGVENQYWSCMYNSIPCNVGYYCEITHFWNYVPQYNCWPW